MPTEFALAAIVPNPVHRATRFHFALPREVSVHMGLHDVQGRELAVLADGTYPAGRHFVDWSGTASRIEGVGLDVLAREAQLKHEHAFRPVTNADTELAVGGNYQYRVRGEYHLFNPLTVSKLQHAVRQESYQTFREYTDLDKALKP